MTACRLVGAELGAALRKAWSSDGRVQAWWEKHPIAETWDSALRDFASERGRAPTVRHFLGFVRAAIYKHRGPAEKGTPAPAATPDYYQATRRRRPAGGGA